MSRKQVKKPAKAGKQRALAKHGRVTAVPSASAALLEEMKLLNARMTDMAAAAIEVHQLRRGQRELAAAGVQEAASLAAGVQTVPVKFKKTAGPATVRITLVDTQEEVLSPGKDQGVSSPFKVGTELDAFIEVKGNLGDVAVIELSNAIPKVIRMSAFPGESGNQGTKPLLVVG